MALATPEFLQTKQYSAKTVRGVLLDLPVQSGVVGAGDMLVSQRGAGANMSVDAAAGPAWVMGQTSSRQGIYHLYNDATMNISIAGNASGNPRLDQIVLHVYDSVDGAAAQDAVQLEVIQGSPNASASLGTRAGAAALPATSLLLADVLVANGAASITNAAIRDRRPWARGAYVRILRNTGNYTTSATIAGLIDATNLAPRIECSGAPLRVRLRGEFTHSVANGRYIVAPTIDGLAMDGSNGLDPFLFTASATAGLADMRQPAWDLLPSAGSHVIGYQWAVITAGTATANASSTSPLQMTVEELTRQNTANNPAGYG